MIPEIGHFALILALCLALVQASIPLLGATLGIPNWMTSARPISFGQCLFLIIAFACLIYAFVNNDFSVKYVAENSNSALPLPYRISAVWGAHEGSLLLWAVILGLWTSAVALFSRSLPLATVARVVSVMGMISVGFLLFMLFTSNPFDRIAAVAEGRDLNPLLQDPGLVLHPPMLYMGYVGFSVAFSFAVAALIGGHLDAAWARWSRPWTTVAWVFLTLGIALGSWWAYYELGWGGWWFWDPVENASFMPWLVGTALIHSLAVSEKRDAFKSWTVLLALLAFSLSLLGTFLVRSGVLTSVHAFASDPKRGLYILIFLGIVVGGSLALYSWRGPQIRSGGSFKALSKETALLVNNVLLVAAAGCVLLGTLFPLVMDAVANTKISVGLPFFETAFAILMLPLLFFIGIGPIIRWKQQAPSTLAKQLHLLAIVGLALIVMLIPTVVMITLSIIWQTMPDSLSSFTWAMAKWTSLLAALWITLTSLQHLYKHVAGKRLSIPGLFTVPRAVWGMTLAHLGVAVFVTGVTLTKSESLEKDIRLDRDQIYELAGYTFQFKGVSAVRGPNYRAKEGTIIVGKNGQTVAELKPQKRAYQTQGNPMTEAAIDAGLFRDLYVAMGEALDNGAWSVRIYYKPFVRWIWLGAIFMALGGVVAISDRRYRLAATRQGRPVTIDAGAASTAKT